MHAGCDNCYAETLARRWGNDIWGNDKPRKQIDSVWNELSKYQRLARRAGEKHRVFVGSMMDIFEKPMPLIDSNGQSIPYDTMVLRQKLFHNINMGHYDNLIFLFLTKRPSNINKYIPYDWSVFPPKNVWFGTSISNQETAKTLIPQLLKVKGNRFLSIEPQIDSIDLTAIKQTVSDGYSGDCLCWYHQPYNGGELLPEFPTIHWVIQGGESGHHKRPFDINWAYDIKRQCQESNVHYFFKQIDKVQAIPQDLLIRQFPL